jgi:hypothetical protein
VNTGIHMCTDWQMFPAGIYPQPVVACSLL